MKIKSILCAVALLAFAGTAPAQSPASGGGLDLARLSQQQIAETQLPAALRRLVTLYRENGDQERLSWALESLHALEPNVGEVSWALARSYAARGEKSKTYDLLLRMQKQGYGADLADDADFAKVADTPVWKYIVEGLEANLKPFGEGRLAYTLPGGDRLLDSLAWDPARKQLLVGSVREGAIYRIGKGGQLEKFIETNAANGLWAVYGLAAVPADDALYVASTASVYFRGVKTEDLGKAGVFRFKLSDGSLVEKYLLAPAGKPRVLSSIAAGRNGRVFAADGVDNVIYRLDSGALQPMIANPRLVSVRGLALSGDESKLYFADYAMGILGVDLAAGKGFDLAADPAKLVLGGIDGLYWYDGTLVVIENGMSPRRVMRLTLSDDGRRILRAMPLDAGNPAFKLPTWGAVAGDELYFIANSQKNQYDGYGTPKAGAELAATEIFRSNLRFSWSENGTELEAPVRAEPRATSESFPGDGPFSNVEAYSQSVSGD